MNKNKTKQKLYRYRQQPGGYQRGRDVGGK